MQHLRFVETVNGWERGRAIATDYPELGTAEAISIMIWVKKFSNERV